MEFSADVCLGLLYYRFGTPTFAAICLSASKRQAPLLRKALVREQIRLRSECRSNVRVVRHPRCHVTREVRSINRYTSVVNGCGCHGQRGRTENVSEHIFRPVRSLGEGLIPSPRQKYITHRNVNNSSCYSSSARDPIIRNCERATAQSCCRVRETGLEERSVITYGRCVPRQALGV